ncbi:MAG: virulence protein RhuM/Fic/DOC family protein [Candidatus Paceibacterota bacterium]
MKKKVSVKKVVGRGLKNDVVIFQAKNGALELKGDFRHETVWANRMQMSEIFGVNPQAITKHIQNIYKESELERKTTSSKMELVQTEGGRTVSREVDIYNLDVLIAVGYRISSVMGTQFRQWATKTLREHLTKGYTLNKKVILKNYDQFIKNVSDIQMLLPETVVLDPKSILELVKEYAVTWSKLDAYDREALTQTGVSKKKIKISSDELLSAVETLKGELLKKREATDIFAQERAQGNVEGILGNVMQSFAGADVYKTLEEKAAHLLYFLVKNHPFVDGNKRTGAFTFIWFLRRAGVRGARNINPSGLTAITLLIAESDPKHKEKVVALVVELLKTK